MLKNKSYLLIVSLLFTLLISSSVGEASYSIDDVSFYGGLNYNTYSISDDLADLEAESDDLSSGGGFYLGSRYLLTKDSAPQFFYDNLDWALDNLALGLEIERMSLEAGNTDASNTGFLATSSYRLSNSIDQLPDQLFLNFGLGLYRGRLDSNNNIEIETSNTRLGFKTGIEGRINLADLGYLIDVEKQWNEDIGFGLKMGYRFARPIADVDFSGLEFAIQSEYSF
ncbi:hypothetical protein [Halonatronum saccharophilum]|uniref:hypothetical protein n=1 Tax=Halonatronum saccharophilum TaxID=150060 RepID=UPI0004847C43|nr:hypothetical protein [Halonatronum saccharophilum]